MLIEDAVLQVIDTPEFQRLRQLKQLGTCYHVFPGASHNRFEHSIGVSYLSGQMIDHLHAKQPELSITDEERLLVRIAGAVHDLGHGPFSHVFDGQFIPAARARRGLPHTDWHHEDMSLDLFDRLLDNNGLDVFKNWEMDEPTARAMVKGMVYGAKDASKGKDRGVLFKEDRAFLYEIVGAFGGLGAALCSASVHNLTFFPPHPSQRHHRPRHGQV